MSETETRRDFIREIVAEDLAAGKNGGRVITRFPPEPNGYLHIGHAKAICLDFGLPLEARRGGLGPAAPEAWCNLRFDDTNPAREEQRYIDAIMDDIHWLGFDWPGEALHASDYFDTLFEWACRLIEAGLAYVDDQSADEVRRTRGTLTTPGTASPYRDRPADESLDLFRRMKAGEFPDASRVLRAKIDMASPNIVMRDPVMYRVLHKPHPRTGDTWCVYPMYDWAHGQSDWIEGVTHSLCDTGYVIHRPLYDWFLDKLIEIGVSPEGVDYRPRQYEFAKMGLTHTILSKRHLRTLVEHGVVAGWDDPRVPTLTGMRRRGYPARALVDFTNGVGVAKRENVIELARLEHHVRDELNRTAPRVMGVLDPLKVTITNWPEGEVDELEAVNNPEDESAGTRVTPFSGTIYIERGDFMENAPRKFFRLDVGREVRLRYAYFITCNEAVKDDRGNVVELRCTYDPATRGGDAPDGRKVKGTLHWVSAEHAVACEVREYEPLLTDEPDDAAAPEQPEPADPDAEYAPATEQAGRDAEALLEGVNKDSLTTITAHLEPAVRDLRPGDVVQFERTGYFAVDPDTTAERPVFNRTVTLKDSWKGGK